MSFECPVVKIHCTFVWEGTVIKSVHSTWDFEEGGFRREYSINLLQCGVPHFKINIQTNGEEIKPIKLPLKYLPDSHTKNIAQFYFLWAWVAWPFHKSQCIVTVGDLHYLLHCLVAAYYFAVTNFRGMFLQQSRHLRSRNSTCNWTIAIMWPDIFCCLSFQAS